MDLFHRIGNPCLSPLADSYLTIVSEAQKQVGVNRAAPLLENTIIGLRSDTLSRAQVAAFLAVLSLTRDVARYSFDLFSCRGYDLSVYNVVADPTVPSV